ncbi:MAG: hypothetical protein AAGA03_04205 [Planctomycetota bacterium]
MKRRISAHTHGLLLAAFFFSLVSPARSTCAEKGTLTITANDQESGEPAVTRIELYQGPVPPGDLYSRFPVKAGQRTARRRPAGKPVVIRRAASAGVGIVLDRQLDATLADGAYSFRAVRGPEYRIVSGNFSLEETSLDQHGIELPRMVDMLQLGWTSGDCFVPPAKSSLPLRMVSEDLHLAATSETSPRLLNQERIPGRSVKDPLIHDPLWIERGVQQYGGLCFYGLPADDPEASESDQTPKPLPVQRIVSIRDGGRVAIENPFAWQLPVWLASDRIDGMFVLGDWLQLDKRIRKVPDGRPRGNQRFDADTALGHWAEQVYQHVLECGIEMPPLAGCGSEGQSTPVGYNRLYVGIPKPNYDQTDQEVIRVSTPELWWSSAWRGNSVATNGPLLRPMINGMAPGHHFEFTGSDKQELTVELSLTVRDPVDYLEVIHNGRVHYTAKLDEFAKQKGRIPPLLVGRSGWVLVRVVTLFRDHYRAAISAPWYIRFNDQPRVSSRSVRFFQDWLSEYEERLRRLPAEELAPHVPFVKAARKFWSAKATSINAS